MTDRDLVEAKFDIIERNLAFIRKEYAGKQPAAVEEDYKGYQALKFSLFEIVEACIDVANHVIAAERLERAESYARMFTVLGENDVISREAADHLSAMARFRNLLVHRYAALDVDRVMAIVNEHLTDVDTFMRDVTRWMNR